MLLQLGQVGLDVTGALVVVDVVGNVVEAAVVVVVVVFVMVMAAAAAVVVVVVVVVAISRLVFRPPRGQSTITEQNAAATTNAKATTAFVLGLLWCCVGGVLRPLSMRLRASEP